jgi:rhomboid family GlyGly-CTERM serine protease
VTHNTPFIGTQNRGGLAVVGVILLAGIVILALGDEARVLLRYDREGIQEGQFWRLATAHVTHLGVSHGIMNLLALAVLAGLFGDLFTARRWLLGCAVSALAIDIGLWWLEPQVRWYVGLSGVLHGLIVLGAVAMWLNDERLGLGLLLGVVAKLGWEQAMGPLPFTESAAGGPVLVASHLYGAGGGLLVTLPGILRANKVDRRQTEHE